MQFVAWNFLVATEREKERKNNMRPARRPGSSCLEWV
jgi:hypothetical protein